MGMPQPTPWYDGFLGVAYRYFDLRMNIVPLFSHRKQPLSLWQDTIHWWVDPAIRVRFVESGGQYWFVMGSDSQKPDTNKSFFKVLDISENYTRFKKGHGGEAYLRFGVYERKDLAGAKKRDLCGCGHEAADHDESDGDACLYKACSCAKYDSFDVNLLRRKKTITDIAFLDEEQAKDDQLAWNCLNANKYSAERP